MTPSSLVRKLATIGDVLARHPSQARHSIRWLRSMLPGHTPLDDGLPWITFGAIRWLERYLEPGMSVFEYGAGGSTLFFAERVRELVSVEHDEHFHRIVRDRLDRDARCNVDLRLRKPEPMGDDEADDRRYRSFQGKYRDVSFRRYVRTIAEDPGRLFDVVMVDGRARMVCVNEAIDKIREGGVLILDNSERPGYAEAGIMLGSRPRLVFRGVTPWTTDVSQTTIWRF